jgi:hypothetical protein
MKKYRCPVCKKSLTREEFERALGILEGRENHFHQEKTDLLNKLRKAEVEKRSARSEGYRQGREAERGQTRRVIKGKDKKIASLQEARENLKKGSTPQTEGLEFEEKLAARLRREFPEDDVQHKGKGGDVLQSVRFERKEAGTIIYECKRTPRISNQHVHQANFAKQTRHADFAVLVTTGRKKGFSGLAEAAGVLIVSPLGAIPLASLVRHHLIEMLRANITRKQRVILAQKLTANITSPQFKNPIEQIVQTAAELQEMVRTEARDHLRVWKKRWDRYTTIHWDGSVIQSNLKLVLHGQEPKSVTQPRAAPLQLPAATR